MLNGDQDISFDTSFAWVRDGTILEIGSQTIRNKIGLF